MTEGALESAVSCRCLLSHTLIVCLSGGAVNLAEVTRQEELFGI